MLISAYFHDRYPTTRISHRGDGELFDKISPLLKPKPALNPPRPRPATVPKIMLNLTGFQICDVSRGRKPLALVLCPLLAMWCFLYVLSLTVTIERDKVRAEEIELMVEQDGYHDVWDSSYENTLIDLTARYPWLQRRRYTPNRLVNGGIRKRSDSGGGNSSTMVFVHNQKSGGSSVKTCLKMMADGGNIHRCTGIFDGNGPEHILDAMGSKSKHRKCYVGESSFGICDDFDDDDCSYFAMLRDPYERVISSYEYCKTADDPLCRAGNTTELSLEEWAIQQGSYFFRQLLFRPTEICMRSELFDQLVAVYRNKTDTDVIPDFSSLPCWYRHKLLLEDALTDVEKLTLLRYILSNFENWFGVIGMTEEFDTSLKFFQMTYDLPFYDVCSGVLARETAYTDQAESENSKVDIIRTLTSRLASSPDVRRALLYDVEIFKKATEVFEDQKKALFG